MATFPDARHSTTQECDKQGHISDRDHRIQRHERDVGDKESGIPGFPLYQVAPSTLIFKTLLDEGVVFELIRIKNKITRSDASRLTPHTPRIRTKEANVQ